MLEAYRAGVTSVSDVALEDIEKFPSAKETGIRPGIDMNNKCLFCMAKSSLFCIQTGIFAKCQHRRANSN